MVTPMTEKRLTQGRRSFTWAKYHRDRGLSMGRSRYQDSHSLCHMSCHFVYR